MKHEQLRKDAAAKKREEENKRKEAEQQKGQLDTDPPRSHCSSSAPVLPCPPSPQNEASKQDATPSKQPPASHTVQSPDPEHSRPPGRCPGRASQGDSSIDLQGTASRKPSETPIEHCRGPSACVHPRSWEGGNSSKNQGTSSVEKRREQRLLIIQRERSRKELFRRKNKAAAVIQRAWRSYQLRKHLSRLLHLKQLGAREVLRCTQVCTALLLQVWRKELELKFPKSISVSRTSKSPSKGSSATKYARHSVLRQIYGCSQEGKGHHPIKSSKAPAVLHLSSVNSLQSIHLDNSGRSKKFSYNLQPSSQSKNKPKL